jgi:outer membrane immunogenic protein
MLLRDKIAAVVAALLLAVGYCVPVAKADGLPKSGLLPIGEAVKAGSWTGCYVGGAVGYGWTRSEFTAFGQGETSLSSDDILLSLGVGCDLHIANSSVVLGVMADATWSNLSSAWQSKGAIDAEWQWFVGGRAGFLLTPRTLVYGLAGWTALDGGVTFNLADKTDLGDLKGLTYGGGIEQVISGGWSLKLEYRYIQFGDDTAPNGAIDGLKDGTDIDTGTHQVRIGAVYRFGAK